MGKRKTIVCLETGKQFNNDGAAHYLETAKHLNEYLNDHGTGR